MFCSIKKCLKLKSKYKGRVETVVKYAKTIDDFNDLVDPRTLAHHCLGLEPATFILCAIAIEEKNECLFPSLLPPFPSFYFFFTKCFSPAEMTTKFNHDTYTRMREKKDEPLSSLRKKVVRVVDQGTPATPATSIPETTKVPSPATSVEELTPRTKKPRMEDKGKEKASSWSSNVWDDASLALTRAQDLFNADKLKVLSEVPSNEMVGHHVHKLIQAISLCNLLFTFFLL